MTITSGDSRHTRTSGTSAATDLCRLTVLSTHSQVDMAVPATIPLALLVPGIVDTIRSHRGSNDFDDVVEEYEPSEWVLAKIGQAPLSSTLTLNEHGIRDGDLLVLESARASAPAPLFDDIMYNVATAGSEQDSEWTPESARVMGSAVGLLATLVGSFALLWSARDGENLVGAAFALLMALLFLVAGALTSRIYGDVRSAIVLGGASLPLAFTGGALIVPGDFGAPHLLLGSALTGATAILGLRVSGVGLSMFTAAASVAVVATPSALVGTLTDANAHEIAAGTLAVGLIGLAFSARLSMLMAKLPLPPVPAPGTSVDPSEDDPDDQVARLSYDELLTRSTRARQYLTGLVVAMTLTTVCCALVGAQSTASGGTYWPGTALAISAAAVLMFRGRTYSSIHQAAPLIAGGSAILVLLTTAAAVTVSGWSIAVFAIAMVFVVAALTLGILAPKQTFSPVMRRIAELIDLAFIASIVPLVCWVTNLYTMMRGL
ncbi:type VII secretion integral membrane protein EccD [Rhodococcus sp. NPDC058521]|uniref:type VII secretion integral membrane protein EccD n=1 Tax=Rhodococcus sp. NPDC058521 TaxID=3346536 RepID=UPI0036579DFD